MKLKFIVTIAFLLVCGIAVADDLAALLPADGIPEGWAGVEEAREFKGQALFRHINGGAELYHDLGFVSLVFKDYRKGEMEIRVEIFDMGSEKGAAGIFAENTKGLETSNEFGVACSIDPYQVIFHRGQYYVQVSCYDDNQSLQDAIKTLTGALDKSMTK